MFLPGASFFRAASLLPPPGNGLRALSGLFHPQSRTLPAATSSAGRDASSGIRSSGTQLPATAKAGKARPVQTGRLFPSRRTKMLAKNEKCVQKEGEIFLRSPFGQRFVVMITFMSVLKYEQVKVNAALEKELAAMPAPLRDIAAHVLMAGGKRLRPLMTLSSARLFGAEGEKLYELAVIPEMIHVATLLHDDVLDGAKTRRGRVSAHVRFDVPRAILAGDALLAAASHKTASFGIPELLACVSESVLMTAAGEAHEIALQHSHSHSFKEYEDIVAGKTGWLIRGSCRLGALYAGATPEQVEAISDYGLNLGIAFQMVDDALDFADEAVTGKPTAGDLVEGKFTPPIMKYLEFLPRCDRENFCAGFREGSFTEEDRARIASDIRRLGFDAEARAMAVTYLEKAERCLDALPQRFEQKLFREALEFVRGRKS